MRVKVKKIGVTFVVMCILAAFAFVLTLFILQNKESRINSIDDQLVKLYLSANAKETTVKEASGKKTVYRKSDIDCVIHLKRAGITLPVLKGNTDRDLSNFRTVLASTDMELGKTRYSIMGHHARDMGVSLGGLGGLQKGDKILIEQGKKKYNFKVSSITVENAQDRQDLFYADSDTSVYLFTCDYSKGGEKIVYRIVKCVKCK